jgi:hypothetical protein
MSTDRLFSCRFNSGLPLMWKPFADFDVVFAVLYLLAAAGEG